MTSIDLSSFGFDRKDEVVYTALLELGEANISALVKKSGIKRTTVYAVVETLHQKGLIGISKKKKRTFYFAEDPRILKKQLGEKLQKLEQVLPELLSVMNVLSRKPKIRYYEGKSGIQQVYKDTLQYPDQELLGWVSNEALKAFDSDFLYNYYLPKRLEKKIWVRVIAADTPEMRTYQEEDIHSLRKTRLVSKKDFPFDVEVNLYGKRNIALMSFEEGFGIIIESEKLWKTLKSVFEMSWLFVAQSE